MVHLEVLVLGQQGREVDGLVRAPLRNHHHTPDLLHLRVVRRAHSVQVAGNLKKGVESQKIKPGGINWRMPLPQVDHYMQ